MPVISSCRSRSSFTCSPHEGGPMHLLLSRPWFGIATEPPAEYGREDTEACLATSECSNLGLSPVLNLRSDRSSSQTRAPRHSRTLAPPLGVDKCGPSGMVQTFTFRWLNGRQLLSDEADQALWSASCQKENIGTSKILDRMAAHVLAHLRTLMLAGRPRAGPRGGALRPPPVLGR